MSQFTAKAVYQSFTQLASTERAIFFALLAGSSIEGENSSREQVFGHLADDAFTAAEAAEYLGISISTFRRHVGHGRIKASKEVGRNQLFATKDLKPFKRALQEVKARGDTDAAA